MVYEPLRIRAILRTGVVADKYFPLDGILLYQTYRREEGPQVATLPGVAKNDATLPLAIERPGQPDWYYRCSWAQWSHDVEGCDHWNKRFDVGFAYLMDRRVTEVITGKGKYKAYHMPLYYRVAQWVEWYCVGDKLAIEALLADVTHVGKKTAQGWGRVVQWMVEPIAEDWAVVHNGRLMRGVPVDQAVVLGVPFWIIHYGIRPPYWMKEHQFPVAVCPNDEKQ